MEPVARVKVTVSFLRMDAPPDEPAPALPPSAEVVHLPQPSLALYHELYDTVGAPHLWWLRRVMRDEDLAAILRDPRVSVHVLHHNGVPAGFFELDAASWPVVNLSYFGLMPQAVGKGLGHGFLRRAVDTAWAQSIHGEVVRGVSVNTCTADHPRALPMYLRVGFRPVRQVREVWNIPLRLGMVIPEHLRT